MRPGVEFLETFRMLSRDLGFSKRVAFMASMWVHRGGGLTKDAVYLRGIQQVLDFLADGGDLGLLWGEKIALSHLSIIQELRAGGGCCQPQQ